MRLNLFDRVAFVAIDDQERAFLRAVGAKRRDLPTIGEPGYADEIEDVELVGDATDLEQALQRRGELGVVRIELLAVGAGWELPREI